MRCPATDEWDLLAAEAIDPDRGDAMLEHARGCQACREQLTAARRAHVDRVRMYEAFDRDHDRLREELMAALPDELPVRSGWVTRGARRIGELTMTLNTRTARRATALLVPAACVVIAVIFLSSPGKSAFASAIDRIRSARTIACRFQAFINDSEAPMQTGTVKLSDEFGARFDAEMNAAAMGINGPMGMTVFHKEGGPVLALQPAFKVALRMNVPPNFNGFSQNLDQSSPDAFLNGLRKLTGDADKSLGRSKLNGVEVEGYEISGRKLGLEAVVADSSKSDGSQTDAGARGQLWVDAKSHLPFQLDVELTVHTIGLMGDMHVKATYDRFEFDLPIDPQLFQAQIPEDFRTVEVSIPESNESTLIDALRIFADATHHYPSSLNPSQVSAELMMALASSGRIKLDPADPGSVLSSELVQTSMTVATGCNFAQQLNRDDRNPQYFGDAVGPEDSDQVLMKWSLPDGTRRVIYGDLRAETVPGA